LRSGSFGLSRILPGLALGSVTRPERTFEVFRSASLTCPHRCEPAIDPLCRSPPELSACCPDRLTPISSRGVGPRTSGYPAASARRPSVDRPFGRLSRGHRAHPLPDETLRTRPSASGCQSRSLVPSLWFCTTSTAFSAHHSQACCILLPTLGFVPFPAWPKPRIPRDATTPRRTPPTRRGLSGHPVPWPP
jgi:hypothetical protein